MLAPQFSRRNCKGSRTCGCSSCRCDDDLSSYRPGGHGCGHLEIRIDGEGGRSDATESYFGRLGQSRAGNNDAGSHLAACRREATDGRRHIKGTGTGGRTSRSCNGDFSGLGAAGYSGSYFAVGIDGERCGFHPAESHFRGLRQAGPIEGDDGSNRTARWRDATDGRRHFELLNAVNSAAGTSYGHSASLGPGGNIRGQVGIG